MKSSESAIGPVLPVARRRWRRDELEFLPAALEIIEKERPSLVLLDLMVPKLAGDQILHIMRSSDWGKDIKVFIISNLNESDAPAGLREQGIEGYAVKANLSNDQIDRLVDDILKPAGQQSVQAV